MVGASEPLETLGGGGVPKIIVAWEYLPAGLQDLFLVLNSFFFCSPCRSCFLGSLGSANAQPHELQTWMALGCQSLKLRGQMQQRAAIWYTRKPAFSQTALTSHNSYWTLKAQFCSCLHPFSFNSYCWFIWGIWFGIWDSFPILKKEKKKNTLWIQLSCRLKFCSSFFPFNATASSALSAYFQFSDELLRCWNSNHMNTHHIKQSQRLCWFNIFLPTLPTSKQNPLIA